MSYDSSLVARNLLALGGITEALQGSVTEYAINRPGEFWTESAQGWQRYENPALTLDFLEKLANALAVYNDKKANRDNPIASLNLPNKERCQVVLPPVCTEGTVSLTIRKPSDNRFTLADYENSGRLRPAITNISDSISDWEMEMLRLMQAGEYRRFFQLAVQHRLNIVTVGGTGSGKTTFSKAIIDIYPTNRRVFTIEDAHELDTPHHPNSVHLFYSPAFGVQQVLASCMRMKPDHIFLTELRGDEAWSYLMALRSGHAGSVTSIHANDCSGALFKIGSYIKQSEVGRSLDMGYIMSEVKTTIDIVVYFEKTHLREIYFDPRKKLALLRGEA